MCTRVCMCVYVCVCATESDSAEKYAQIHKTLRTLHNNNHTSIVGPPPLTTTKDTSGNLGGLE